MFPAGRLIQGIAKPSGRRTQTAVTRDAALKWFQELEATAGVQSLKGRGWYGLRRIFTDEAMKYTSNEMTLNAFSGTSTQIRNRVYQDQESLEAKIDAARVGEAIRTESRVAGMTPGPSPLLLDPRPVRQLSVFTVDEIQSAISSIEAQRFAANYW